MLLDVEHKHARKMSYRWLIFNAVLQVLCLLGITFTIFLFPLVVYINIKNQKVKMGVYHIEVSEYDFEIFDFGPSSSICDDVMVENQTSCNQFKKMFGGNIILLCSLIFSFIFNFASVWNVVFTVRNRSQDLTSLYSGFAFLFSFAGIISWFIFALIAVRFVNTMTFGFWNLLIISLVQWLCYLHNRHYVTLFNKSNFYRQMLESEELKDSLHADSREILGQNDSD